MQKIRHALIMAAGRGQRMMPLTNLVPKPMAPYKGSTLVAEGIKKIILHIPNVHITVGYKKAMLAQHVIEVGANSVHNTEGQSNAWWIHNTLLSHLDEPICVLTSDNILDLDFDLLEKNYLTLGEPAIMLVPVKPVEGLEGDYIFHDGQYVTELNRNKPSEIYCSGVQIINPARTCALTKAGGDFYSIWNQLMEQRQLMVSQVYPKQWFTVDTLEQLSRASQ
jgi:NDP-sugar pyrophosphorylase family protein